MNTRRSSRISLSSTDLIQGSEPTTIDIIRQLHLARYANEANPFCTNPEPEPKPRPLSGGCDRHGGKRADCRVVSSVYGYSATQHLVNMSSSTTCCPLTLRSAYGCCRGSRIIEIARNCNRWVGGIGPNGQVGLPCLAESASFSTQARKLTYFLAEDAPSYAEGTASFEVNAFLLKPQRTNDLELLLRQQGRDTNS